MHLTSSRTSARYPKSVCAAVAAGAVALTIAGPAPASSASDQEPVILVRAQAAGPAVSPLLTGVNNDQWFDSSHGLWDPERDEPNPEVVAKTAGAGVGVVRYPGGTPATFFDWTKAVGPTEARGCQTDGRPGNGTPRDSVYGPAEHLEFVTAAGAEASLMAPFVKNSPGSAADWVEYMNATVGTNPRGGTAWAQLRARHGHPEPYRVTKWEVGNEHDRPDQRYWMSEDTATAMRQYTFGGSQPQQGQRLGKGCDFRSTVASDGSAGQAFRIAYPPVAADTQSVRVGADTWAEVADLSAAGPDDRVYTIDDTTGEVGFGNGAHGAVPPAGAAVTADYVSGPHAGFVDFYREMKAVDPGIDVCATWAPITEDTGLGQESFPDLMAEAGHADDYDCLVVHPYTNFRRQFGDRIEYARQMHDWHMLGEGEAARTLRLYADEVRAGGSEDAYVTTSELGALFFGPNDAREYRSWNTAMSHAVYFASQWARLADLGVPWAEGNTLVSEASNGLRAMLGGGPEFVETSEHVVRRAMREFTEGGGKVVDHTVQENPVVTTETTDLGSSYRSLVVTASLGDDGALRLVVVNRDPDRDITARVVPAGYAHTGQVRMATVVGQNDDPDRESFESHNAISHPHEVTLEAKSEETGPGAFAHTFARHSVTVLSLAPSR